eukprot:TRINITY_DN2676_c0_g2_i3.p1 TRINITY_DN2676_c0_g2~~TRINITY_DN2676_c0_g2_i3.p1  ORF type:complete len:653 (-),score=72.83 TRINITY_DN2676_c0_g2_i3:36-1901(-)
MATNCVFQQAVYNRKEYFGNKYRALRRYTIIFKSRSLARRSKKDLDELDQDVWDIRDDYMMQSTRDDFQFQQVKQLTLEAAAMPKNKVDLYPDDAMLTSVIKKAENSEQIISLIFAYKDAMNNIHISAAAHKLAKTVPPLKKLSKYDQLRVHNERHENDDNLDGYEEDVENERERSKQDYKKLMKEDTKRRKVKQALDILALNYQIQASEFSERTMTNLLWAMSKIGYRNEQFYQTWLQYALDRIRFFSPRQIAQSMWSMSNKGWGRSQLEWKFFEMMVQLAIIKLRRFECTDLCQILWALAKNPDFLQEQQVGVLFTKAKDKITQNAAEISSLGITNLIWSYGLQSFLKPEEFREMFDALSHQIIRRQREFNAPFVGNIIFAFMRVHYFNFETFNVLYSIATEEIWDLQPLGLSNVLYSFAWFQVRFCGDSLYSKLFVKASSIYLSNIDAFENLPFANIVYAYAMIANKADKELYEICCIVLQKSLYRVILGLDQFDSYSVSLITWAYGRMQLGTDEFYKLVRNRVKVAPKQYSHQNLITILQGITYGKYNDVLFTKYLLVLLSQFNRNVFKERQLQLLDDIFGVLQTEDKELEEKIVECSLRLGLRENKRVVDYDQMQD